MKSASLGVLTLFLVAALVRPAVAQYNDCRNLVCPQGSCNCSCEMSHSNGYELSCPMGSFMSGALPSVMVSVFPAQGGTVEIKCPNFDSEYDLLQGLHLGPKKTFEVKWCQLPTVPFKKLITDTGVSNVQILALKGANYGNQLTRYHLSDLGDIDILTLTNDKLTDLDEDLFQETGNLTWLNLRENSIRLPKNIFRPVYKLEVLELGSNSLNYLEPGIFRNLTKLRLLNLWGNRLRNLSRSLFSDLINLESLDLNSNHLTTLPPDIFSDLPKLKKINLHGNSFTTLPQGLFSSNTLLEIFQLNFNRVELKVIPPGLLSNLPGLQEVNMHHCNVSSLPEDFIWKSPSITNFTLSWNRITSLPSKLFRDNHHLLDIDMSHNLITTVPDQMFVKQQKLDKLNLSYNRIRNISNTFFDGLESLSHLDVSHNQISEVSRTQRFPSSLTHVDLSWNEISDLSYSNLPFGHDYSSVFNTATNLRSLQLSHNHISRIYADWRRITTSLEDLDLSYNNISMISSEDVDFLSGPVVDLSHNNITVVNFNDIERDAVFKFGDIATTQLINKSTRLLIKELVASTVVPLVRPEDDPFASKPLAANSPTASNDGPTYKRHVGNPLRCDCNAYGLMRLLRDDMGPEVKYLVEVKDAAELVCQAPIILHSKVVKDVDPDDVNCDWVGSEKEGQKSRCPRDCSCRYRPYNSALLIDCSSKNLTTWPEVLPPSSAASANHTELYFFNNLLTEVPSRLHSSYRNVTHLYLSENRLSSINLTHFSPHLRVLDLKDNNFTTLGESLAVIENLKDLSMITLMNNPWKCDCAAKPFIKFIISNPQSIRHYRNITCSVDGGPQNAILVDLSETDICPISAAAMVVGICVAIIGLLLGGLCAAYYRYQKEIKVWLYAHRMCLWFVTEDELDKDKRYDAFISYSHQDEAFVVNELVRVLENNSPKYKLCLHYRDWVVGDFIPNQIARSVEDSRRTVVVLSPSFIESVWGRMEFRTAHQQALTERRARVIIILYGEIGDTEKLDPELKAYLTMNTYVKWGDPWFWDKLLYAMPHPPEITKGIPSLCRRRPKPQTKTGNEKLVATSDTAPATTPPAMNIIEPLKTMSTKPI